MREYKGEDFSSILQEKQVVFVKFYATWCGPCKMLAPVVDELAKDLQDVLFIEVDIDSYRDVAVSNNVRGVPTCVVFNGGKEVSRKTGFAPKDELAKLFN